MRLHLHPSAQLHEALGSNTTLLLVYGILLVMTTIGIYIYSAQQF